jgi:hypothetical protein
MRSLPSQKRVNNGWVTERSIVHAWKACVPLYGTGGSNPPPSATDRSQSVTTRCGNVMDCGRGGCCLVRVWLSVPPRSRSLPEAAHDSQRLLVFSSAAAHKAAGRMETMTKPTQPLHRVLIDPVAPWPHLSPEAPFRSNRAPKFQRKIIFTRSSRERGELFENHGTPRRCAPVIAGIPPDPRFSCSTHRRCAATAIGSTRGVR